MLQTSLVGRLLAALALLAGMLVATSAWAPPAHASTATAQIVDGYLDLTMTGPFPDSGGTFIEVTLPSSTPVVEPIEDAAGEPLDCGGEVQQCCFKKPGETSVVHCSLVPSPSEWRILIDSSGDYCAATGALVMIEVGPIFGSGAEFISLDMPACGSTGTAKSFRLATHERQRFADLVVKLSLIEDVPPERPRRAGLDVGIRAVCEIRGDVVKSSRKTVELTDRRRVRLRFTDAQVQRYDGKRGECVIRAVATVDGEKVRRKRTVKMKTD
ncbi:hypothetical protein F0U44_11910 [Nocardioides humilatus]|uniref:Uncharacterized protein n=1 Tax=Nocardioides humilatus TaxID=2607660 RepID=A0A5B1LH77_9ACTN|nr:hypothetical protein [Nocardioides humilatus]KAA1419150.1 hypothetical protein F0U44_11910 [Nocardioides humilatus]